MEEGEGRRKEEAGTQEKREDDVEVVGGGCRG
jgi:hypothetical protein